MAEQTGAGEIAISTGRFATIVAIGAAGVVIGILLTLAVTRRPPRPPEPPPPDTYAVPPVGDRLLVGIGDRLEGPFSDAFVSYPAIARERGLPIDLFQMWLPRGWLESWIPKPALLDLVDRGSIPVVVHYFFNDGISRERLVRERPEWHRSLVRMARAVRIDAPVLVILAPEFNDAPPPGETRLTTWPGFADELAEAARLVREQAPNALVGVCAGDFSPDRDLETVLAPVAHRLDFLAFQEMRAATDPDFGPSDYLEIGRSAVAYASYLHDTFGRPVLIAYVAVSSYPDWIESQAAALHDLADHRGELLRHGVFGVVYFQLRDDPDHEGYFGPAEKHFGLFDTAGEAKPAAAAFRRLADAP